jgi:addiction module HigA family antidote
MQMFNPPHPGQIVKEALEAMPMTVTDFASHIGVSRVALSRVLNGHAGITPEMSIKISQAFGQPSGDIWFLMQCDHDFWHASHKKQRPVRPLKIAA